MKNARSRFLNKLEASSGGQYSVALIDVNGVSHKSSILPLRAVGSRGIARASAPEQGAVLLPRSTFLYPSPGYERRISRAPTLSLPLATTPFRQLLSVGPPPRSPARRSFSLAAGAAKRGEARRAEMFFLVRFPPPPLDLPVRRPRRSYNAPRRSSG